MTMPPQEIISVIYVVGNLRTNGPTLQLLYLILNLDRTRFKPIVIVTSASGAQAQIECRLEQAGVEVIRIEAGKLASMYRAPLCLRRVARQQDIRRELGWRPSVTVEEGLQRTVRWYLENDAWWRPLLDRHGVGQRLGTSAP